jgi:predicted acylesterase/phospholipase RssA
VGFNLGVVQALRDRGYAVDEGPMLGTSAGAYTAACLVTGVTLDELLAGWDEYNRTPSKQVIEVTSALFADRRDDRVTTMALRLPSGRRVPLRGGTHSLADAVAASSSPPRLAAPHVISGQRYIDAGIRSATSADRAGRAQVLLVVAPMTRGVLGLYGSFSERLVRYEMLQWRRRTGGRVLYVRPNSAIASLVGNERDALFDHDVARRTYDAAYPVALGRLERFEEQGPRRS